MNVIKQCHLSLLFLLDAHEIYTTEILVTYKRAMSINVGNGVHYSEASPCHSYSLLPLVTQCFIKKPHISLLRGTLALELNYGTCIIIKSFLCVY